jgi:hypothetical protein
MPDALKVSTDFFCPSEKSSTSRRGVFNNPKPGSARLETIAPRFIPGQMETGEFAADFSPGVSAALLTGHLVLR